MYKIIMHNQISVDGAISGFPIDTANYYKIVNGFNPEMYLVGSNTALAGIKMFSKGNMQESDKDFEKPMELHGDNRPFWVIPDTTGKLQGKLHHFRNYEHCRDVIVLASVETPQSYLQYLLERNYTTIISGEVKVDFQLAFQQLRELYNFTRVLTDNGGVLSAVLFNKGLIDQISLIVSPFITDKKNPKLFRELKLGKRVISLEPKEVKVLDNKSIWMLMDVLR